MKIKSLWLVAAMFFTVVSLFAQDRDKVLFTLDGDPVYVSEFVRVSTKNLQQDEKPDLQESFDIFLNFKLKVKAAEDEGIDTTLAFINDLAQYRSQLASPYLMDQTVTQELLEEAWERSQIEYNSSHILIGVGPNASPGDTLIAFQRAMNTKSRLDSGEDFETVAREVSDDPSARDNGGKLGYYTVFDLVYPFENAAYNTPVGEVSEPVRTDFGYHLIKINDRIPTRGQIKVAIILKSSMYGMSEEEHESLKGEIFEIYDKLQAGEDFAELAAKYSDDKNSGARGGELPWFGVGSKPKDFEEAAFSVKNVGEYSEPIFTSMGWYIFKLLDKRKLTFDEMLPILERKIARDAARSAKSKTVIVEKLKKEYGFTFNQDKLDDFYRMVDPSIFSARWDPSPARQKKGVLFTINDKEFLQSEFANELALQMKVTNEMPIAEFIDKEFEEFVQKSILAYEETRLEIKYPEFRDLYREFRDGNLLFEIMDKKVWSKASSDTVGLQAYFDDNRDKYQWDERLNGTIIWCKADSALDDMAAEMRNAVVKYSKTDTSEKALEEVLNAVATKYSGSFEIRHGPFSHNENSITDNIKWKKGVSDLQEENDSRIFVWVRSILEPMSKTLLEARGQATADYQEYLDAEWIKALRQKYTVKVNEKVLNSIQL